MGKSQKSILERLQTIDRKIIYVVVLICLIFPLLSPLGIPFRVSAETQNSFNIVNSLKNKPGSIVFFDFDAHPVVMGETGLAGRSLMYNVFRLPVKIVFFSLYSEALVYFDWAVTQTRSPDKIYSIDYVYLGYFVGGEAAVAKIVDDLRGIAYADYKGTPVDQIPVLKGITGGKDATMLIGWPFMNSKTWILNSWVAKYHPTYVLAIEPQHYTTDVVYLRSGLYSGLVIGSKGSAEYDLLMDRKSITLGQMDSASLYGFLTIALIAIGNIGYFGTKLRKKTEKVEVK